MRLTAIDTAKPEMVKKESARQHQKDKAGDSNDTKGESSFDSHNRKGVRQVGSSRTSSNIARVKWAVYDMKPTSYQHLRKVGREYWSSNMKERKKSVGTHATKKD